MPRFAANISLMFQEVDFLARFARAARAGFAGVECLFPYAFEAADLRAELAAHGLELVLLNTPPGDWEAGERGLAALPGREVDFARAFEQALSYARALDCSRIHVMAGIPPRGADPERCMEVYLRNLRRAAARAGECGIMLLIEPINSRDLPGYFLNRTDAARRIIERVAAPNLALQLDLYHCQIMEGDLATRIRELLPLIGHVQIAGVPERHEPDRGEVHYPYLFALLDELGYAGWVGCEYRPAAGTEEGLDWLRRWRRMGE